MIQWIAKRRKSKRRPKKVKPTKRTMQGFILSRPSLDGNGHVVMGAYATRALAEAARTAKTTAYVDAQNAQRDAAHAAGESFDALLAVEDVLPFTTITEVTVDM